MNELERKRLAKQERLRKEAEQAAYNEAQLKKQVVLDLVVSDVDVLCNALSQYIRMGDECIKVPDYDRAKELLQDLLKKRWDQFPISFFCAKILLPPSSEIF